MPIKINALNLKTLPIMFVFLNLISCSAKAVDIPQEHNCYPAYVRVSALFSLFKIYDIKDVRTREKIKEFFMNSEDIDIFIASLTYLLRTKKAFYGKILDFKVKSFGENENECSFNLILYVQKKYPLGDVLVEAEVEMYKIKDSWFVKRPKYIGEVERRGDREERRGGYIYGR